MQVRFDNIWFPLVCVQDVLFVVMRQASDQTDILRRHAYLMFKGRISEYMDREKSVDKHQFVVQPCIRERIAEEFHED